MLLAPGAGLQIHPVVLPPRSAKKTDITFHEAPADAAPIEKAVVPGDDLIKLLSVFRYPF
jgi:hypothetical protein